MIDLLAMSQRERGRASDPAEERHEEIYAEPRLPRFVIWQLAPGLLAGRNPLSERDVRELAEAGVTHVLDLREKAEWEIPGRHGSEALEALAARKIERLHVAVGDFSPPSAKAFAAACDWLDRVANRPGAVVFAHCRAGLQRTPTILAAWLARREGIGFDAALARLRAGGYPGEPMPEQREAARAWLQGR